MRGLVNRIVSTSSEFSLLILRLAVGGVLLPHGLQKTFGMFGGPGFSETMAGLSKHYHPALAFMVIFTEFAGALLLIFGFLTRAWALGVIVLMSVALTQHLPNGFFMNWAGSQKGEGFEYHVLMIAMALVLFIRGAGALSMDRSLCKKTGTPK